MISFSVAGACPRRLLFVKALGKNTGFPVFCQLVVEMKALMVWLVVILGCASCGTNSVVSSKASDAQTDEKKAGYTLDQFDKAVEALTVAEPTRRDPLQVSAMLVPERAAPGETVVAVLKIQLLNGWHFYSHVPNDSPYIATKWHLGLGHGVRAVDDWSGPEAISYSADKPDLKVYKGSNTGSLVFFRELVVEDGATGEIKVSPGLFYQVCDADICLKPRKKIMDLLLTIDQ